jgi:SAM-dependent methyltransferase
MPSSPEEYRKMYEVEEQLWWYKALHLFVLRSIEKSFGSNKNIRILDAGCGTGGMLMALKKTGYQYLKGIDHSRVAVQLAKERGLDIEEGNLSDFGTNETFDVIICNDVFCYMNDQEISQTIAIFYQVLNPNGLIISNNNAFDIFWGTHDIAIASQRRFTWNYFRNVLIDRKLKIKSYTYWTFILSPLVLVIRLFQRLKYSISPQKTYSSDVSLPPLWLNDFFFRLVASEQRFLSFQPFGSSLFWVVQKS